MNIIDHSTQRVLTMAHDTCGPKLTERISVLSTMV